MLMRDKVSLMFVPHSPASTHPRTVYSEFIEYFYSYALCIHGETKCTQPCCCESYSNSKCEKLSGRAVVLRGHTTKECGGSQREPLRK